MKHKLIRGVVAACSRDSNRTIRPTQLDETPFAERCANDERIVDEIVFERQFVWRTGVRVGHGQPCGLCFLTRFRHASHFCDGPVRDPMWMFSGTALPSSHPKNPNSGCSDSGMLYP